MRQMSEKCTANGEGNQGDNIAGIREIILHRRIRAAGEKLHRAGLDEALLLRLSDSEIFALSRSKPEEIMLKKNESLRWAMLLEKFRSEKG